MDEGIECSRMYFTASYKCDSCGIAGKGVEWVKLQDETTFNSPRCPNDCLLFSTSLSASCLTSFPLLVVSWHASLVCSLRLLGMLNCCNFLSHVCQARVLPYIAYSHFMSLMHDASKNRKN